MAIENQRCGTCLHWREHPKQEGRGTCVVGRPTIGVDGTGRWPYTEQCNDCSEWEPGPEAEDVADLVVEAKAMAGVLILDVKGPGGKTLVHECRLCGRSEGSPTAIVHHPECVVPRFLVAVFSL